jgi:hypothetical protein
VPGTHRARQISTTRTPLVQAKSGTKYWLVFSQLQKNAKWDEKLN